MAANAVELTVESAWFIAEESAAGSFPWVLAITPPYFDAAERGPFADRHDVWQRLLDRGVLVRETGPQGWLRVSVGTPDETEAFYAALAEVLKEVR